MSLLATAQRNSRTLTIITFGVVTIWLIAQIAATVHFHGSPCISDAALYRSIALENINSGNWYPNPSQIVNHSYIFNPGYTNLLILVYRLCGSFDIMPLVNMGFNMILLTSIYHIILRLCNRPVAQIATILFCILPSNTFSVLPTMSELPFTCAAYASIALLQHGNPRLFTSGVLIIIAHYIRPLGILFLIPSLIYLAVRRYPVPSIISYISGCTISAIALLAINSHTSHGHMFLSSTTTGVNMIIGANEDATGTYNDEVFLPGKAGDIDAPDLFYRDSVLTRHAIEFIIANPGKFSKLAINKLKAQFATDHYLDSSILTSDSNKRLSDHLIPVIAYSMPYYLIIILSIYGIPLYTNTHRLIVTLCLFPFAGQCLICVLTVGSPRYHYPFIPILITFAAIALYHILYIRNTPFNSHRRFFS